MSDAPEVPLAEGVACERTYWIVENGEARPFVVRWLQPRLVDARWECPLEMAWPDGRTRTRSLYGADSTQALFTALSIAGVELLISKHPVYWFEPDDDLGLPVMPAVADIAAERKARFESK